MLVPFITQTYTPEGLRNQHGFTYTHTQVCVCIYIYTYFYIYGEGTELMPWFQV